MWVLRVKPMSSEIAPKGLIPAQVPHLENGTLRIWPSLFARAFSTVFQTGELSSSSLGSRFQRSEVKVNTLWCSCLYSHLCFSMCVQYASTSPCYENPGCPELEDCAVFRDPTAKRGHVLQCPGSLYSFGESTTQCPSSASRGRLVERRVLFEVVVVSLTVNMTQARVYWKEIFSEGLFRSG